MPYLIWSHLLRTMACVLCHKPTVARKKSVLHPESSNNTEQGQFFVKFVSPEYQWPVGQDKLYWYLCMSSCKAKLQQGADKAADLTKVVNDLRAQHVGPNQSTSPVIEILPVPAEERSPPTNRVDRLDDADPQVHQSHLGKRKVPCELPSTPGIPKIVGDAHDSTSRKWLCYGTHQQVLQWEQHHQVW